MRRRTVEQRERGLTWVLVCTNDRSSEHACCADAGGEAVLSAVRTWLRERDLFWSRAAVVETACLGLCSEDGTAVAFQPRDEWYSDVRPEDVDGLLAREFEADSTDPVGDGPPTVRG
jgi:(2Fe-2S) ferredoxin